MSAFFLSVHSGVMMSRVGQGRSRQYHNNLGVSVQSYAVRATPFSARTTYRLEIGRIPYTSGPGWLVSPIVTIFRHGFHLKARRGYIHLLQHPLTNHPSIPIFSSLRLSGYIQGTSPGFLRRCGSWDIPDAAACCYRTSTSPVSA